MIGPLLKVKVFFVLINLKMYYRSGFESVETHLYLKKIMFSVSNKFSEMHSSDLLRKKYVFKNFSIKCFYEFFRKNKLKWYIIIVPS